MSQAQPCLQFPPQKKDTNRDDSAKQLALSDRRLDEQAGWSRHLDLVRRSINVPLLVGRVVVASVHHYLCTHGGPFACIETDTVVVP